jgi:flagellin
MSLGVLNNLNAIYAENNLNNTSNGLSKTLQQLSSGSKINSGADDAAGLSLVNGLQANATALAQSQTNSTEGVGLLQVADGALSQVTSLLNRAVTLATEASNGTLNSSQDTAANQEYQSILSEINNIGTTTTFNQEQVFNSNTNIYTGDSSTAGASIDSLNIHSLSSANVGDTGGTMSYAASGSTSNDVFIDLGTQANTTAATVTSAVGNVTLNYLTSDGSTATKTLAIASGATLGSVVSSINGAGLGLTATLTTGSAAGGGTSTDEGIMITGSVGTGTVSSASYSGTLVPTGTVADTDALSGSVTIQDGTNAAQTISMANVEAAEGGAAHNTIADLTAYLGADTSLGIAVTDSSGSLAISTAASGTAALTISSNLTDAANGNAMTYTANAAYNNSIGSATSIATAHDTSTIDSGTSTTTAATATISYSDAAGTNLSGTDLTNQSDSQVALTALNSAITNVAAQDGYIGAQINTLNAVSQVLSTQQENVTSAQNAVQATDYAAATSNMSKYEILSQTGISALAQANSMQQEVTKLLQ